MGKQPALICPTCGQSAKLSEGKFGTKAECCGLWSWGGKVLVDGNTHRARIHAHAAFDKLWKSGQMTRSTAYARLALALEMTSKDCHISLMDAETAIRVSRAVRDGWLDYDERDATPAPEEILVQVRADGSQPFTAGLVIVNGKCVQTAPILRKRCRGKSANELRDLFARRGWKAVIVTRGPATHPLRRDPPASILSQKHDMVPATPA